jgi:hypothetical protein
MSAKRWLGSPLAGTAGVLAGLCLIAIPLRKLTSAPPVSRSASLEVSAAGTPSVLRIKLLAPAKRLFIKTPDGVVLLDMQQPSSGEYEHDAVLPIADSGLDLSLSADFGDSQAETAVFITVLPDGREEQTRYATGSGLLEETLSYNWHHEH